MKNLITVVACLTLLLVFVMQFTNNQITHMNLTNAQKQIEIFENGIEKEGCVTESNITDLKNKLVSNFDCDINDIIIEGDSTPKVIGEKVNYKITFPVNNLIASAKVFGISAEENRSSITIEETAISQLVDRSKSW